MSQAQVILGFTATNLYCTTKKEIIKKKWPNFNEWGGKNPSETDRTSQCTEKNWTTVTAVFNKKENS